MSCMQNQLSFMPAGYARDVGFFIPNYVHGEITCLSDEELDMITGGRYTWGGFGRAVGTGAIAGGISGAVVGAVFGPGVGAGAGAGALGGGLYSAIEYAINEY